MRSNHDNVTFLDHDVMSPGDARAHSTVTGMAQVKRASHPEYPLERLCSHQSEPFQLTFARHAQQHFLEREDVEVVASRQGLSIRAETEDAIEAALVVLKDLYGAKIRIGPPTIRYHKGVSLEEPWMGMRVRCGADHLDAVTADLVDRNATNISREVETSGCLIQACTPLANLVGYRSALGKLTAGTGEHVMWLSHYAPVDGTPPDGQAA